MPIDKESLKAKATEDLVKRKQEILAQIEEGGEEVHVINQILHVRNMKVLAEKKQKDFLEANKVSTEDLT